MMMVLPCWRLSAWSKSSNAVARLPVQIAGRFVAQKESRIGHDAAGNADALLLAAGERARIMFGPLRKPHHVQRGRHVLPALRFGKVCQQKRQFDVPLRVEGRHQIVELKNKSNMPGAPRGQQPFGEAVQTLAAYADRTARGPVQSANQIEQRALARTGRPHQRQKFAGGNFQVQIAQDVNFLRAAPEYFFHAVNADQSVSLLLVVSLMVFSL